MIFGSITSKGVSTNVETGVVEQQNHIIKFLCIKGAVGLPTEGLKGEQCSPLQKSCHFRPPKSEKLP